ncbi:hypothetical protein BDR06DRAFT_292952 [Suillus hirtellus]|nr:hypothetical protein BDR06DRAFT_292952 [Suillus hirtellus]
MTCDGSVFKLDTVAPADRSCSLHWMTEASSSPVLFLFPLNISSSLSSDSSRSFYWMTDASPSPVLFLFPLNISSSLSSDSSRSFYWMTDASPSPVLSLFPLNISSSPSSDSSRSFYWMTDASLSPVLSLFLLNISSSLSSDSRRSFYWITDAPSFSHVFFLSIHRPAHATPSYTPFTFLFPSHLSFSLRHSFIYPFHLPSSFSSIVQLMSLLHISPFSFLLIHRPAYVTHHIPFSLSFSSIVQPMSLLHIPFSHFFFLLIHRPTRVTPSYFTLLFPSHPSSSLCHSSLYPFHLSLSFSSSSLCRSFIYPFHLSLFFSASYTLFIFLSQFSLHIYCSTHVTPSHTLFTFFLALRHLSLPQSSSLPAALALYLPLSSTTVHSQLHTQSFDILRFFSSPEAYTHSCVLRSTRNSMPNLFYDYDLFSARTPERPAPIRSAHYVHAAVHAAYSIRSILCLMPYAL